ncbi:hypothetical protein J6590_056561 [Homalodisca vitripennis]|nr:hypothetical protein J6590_056561 [Homalodisca vitripennis]
MEESHQLFLEDVSLRLLCVLALDRFGDFVSDQVVAPVRETCAQTLGSIVNLMSKERVEKVVTLLLQLLSTPDWEARHGGLLGLKYLLAVRQDMVTGVLKVTLPSILAGMGDSVDDVGAVAASALIPAAQTIVSDFPDQVTSIVTTVWDLLATQDELASACNSFMGLLAAILSLPGTSHLVSYTGRAGLIMYSFIGLLAAILSLPGTSHLDELASSCNSFIGLLAAILSLPGTSHLDELASSCNSFIGLLAAILSLPGTSHLVSVDEEVVARLWLFLSHNTVSVRKATLQTLTTLTAAKGRVEGWSSQLLTEALRHVFQRALVEPVVETHLLVEQVWGNLVTNSRLDSLLVAVCPHVSCWLCLTMQPAKLHFEPSVLVQARSRDGTIPTEVDNNFDLGQPSTAEIKEVRGRKSTAVEGDQTAASELKLYLGGSETTPAATREQNVTRCRCMAARMLVNYIGQHNSMACHTGVSCSDVTLNKSKGGAKVLLGLSAGTKCPLPSEGKKKKKP